MRAIVPMSLASEERKARMVALSNAVIDTVNAHLALADAPGDAQGLVLGAILNAYFTAADSFEMVEVACDNACANAQSIKELHLAGNSPDCVRH